MTVNQREKEIESRLLPMLKHHPEAVTIYRATSSGAKTMADLINGHPWDKFHDNTDWNKFKDLMQDVSCGTCPDIVIYSAKTHENRIYIEVKDTRELGYGVEESQIIRYFLHLLVTTKKGAGQETDLSRAVLLCAPSRWFKTQRTAKSWNYFVEHFSGLATAFAITLGEIHSEELPVC
jgi:hypothetical protein